MDRSDIVDRANAMLAFSPDEEICQKLGLTPEEVVTLRALKATAPSSAAIRTQKEAHPLT